jgi:hypothetical protein
MARKQLDSGLPSRTSRLPGTKFPEFFPVSREFPAEKGSHVTASTAIESSQFLSLVRFVAKPADFGPKLRGSARICTSENRFLRRVSPGPRIILATDNATAAKSRIRRGVWAGTTGESRASHNGTGPGYRGLAATLGLPVCCRPVLLISPTT